VFAIDLNKICYIIAEARVLGAKSAADDEASGLNAIDDEAAEVLEDLPDDATRAELAGFIDGLTEDEQVELVALTWLGRGSFTRAEWPEAVAEARRAHNRRTAAYLLGTPLLGDYLAEGLAAFGRSCDE
jgi:hypothetical protein